MKKFNFLIFSLLLLLVGCSEEESPTPMTYDNGYLVLNEGNSSSLGTVSYIKNDFSNIYKDIYTEQNNKDGIGKYAQSIFFYGDKAYIVANGSNQITVVNKKTFKVADKISGNFSVPRYAAIHNGKAYVTNANTYGSKPNDIGNTDDFLSIIDLTTNKIESKIDLNATADQIVVYKDKLYIIEPFNNPNLLIVDIATKKVDNTINIGLGNNSMEVVNGILYILNPSGILSVDLSTNSVKKNPLDRTLSQAKNLDIERGKLYFTVDNKVYNGELNTLAVNMNPIITYSTSSMYGKAYGFKVIDDKIFIGDADDFTKEGNLYIYDIAGNYIKTFVSGIGPNNIYKN